MHKNILFLLVLLFPIIAHAQIEATITKSVNEPMPIAVTAFHMQPGGDATISKEISNVVSVNLQQSGLFKPANPRAFSQTPENIDLNGPNFSEWKAIGVQALVTGTTSRSENGRTRVEFRLWDVLSQKQLMGMAYTTTPQNWRRIAHIISDEIYKRLTGEDGYFDSRIVYVAESGTPTNRKKRLAIMDQDGANHKYLTDGKSLVLTPRFSPTRQQITYMSYESGKPKVYLYDITTGKHEVLGHFPGMTFAPRFSPDGNSIIMSMAQNGNTDVYEMPLSTRRPKRITTNSSIDTAPSYSPGGDLIVFESDRGGSQQLYTMRRDGSKLQRVTFGKGRYANPVWSPRGDYIAFTRMYQGKFYIGLIHPDGSGERLISTAHHVEGPTWSPNGRVLSYFKERATGRGGTQRQSKIYTVDITGYNERWLQTPGDGSDPAWSPLNK